MKLNAIQVAGLRALSAGPDNLPDNVRFSSALRLTFTQGQHYGRAELARELLQAHEDAQAINGPEFLRHAGLGSEMLGSDAAKDCEALAHGSVHLCNCGACVDYRNRL